MKSLLFFILALICSVAAFAQAPEQTRMQRLFEAVKKNDANEVKDSIPHWNASVRDDHQNTPLMFAAMNGNHDIVKSLLAAGADPNAYSEDGTTPLGSAVLGGDEETVEILLKAGAKPNDADLRGYSPLMFAAMKANHSIVNDLIKAGADVNHQARDGKNALMIAATAGDDMSILKLMDAHADVNAQDMNGNTPIMYAIDYKNMYGFATLYDYTPKINMENKKGETPLYRAILTHQPILLLMLLSRSNSLNATAMHGKTIQQVEAEVKDPWITLALGALDTMMYRSGGTITAPGIRPNMRGSSNAFMARQRSMMTPSDAQTMPDIPDPTLTGKEMVSTIMHNRYVSSYDQTHSHMQRHIDYVNSVYHTPNQLEKPESASDFLKVMPAAH